MTDLAAPMPFQEDFWRSVEIDRVHIDSLNKICGFISALPIQWTKDENNNLGYHVRLVALNDQNKVDSSQEGLRNVDVGLLASTKSSIPDKEQS